jgi:flavorubredoxin
MYGNTGRLVQTIVDTLKEEGVTVNVHQVPATHLSTVLASAWKSTGLVLGMPTYEYKMFPPMANVVDIFERKHVKNKLVFRFGSFGWSGGAQRELDETVKKLKWDCLDALEFQGMPSAEDEERARAGARELARRVKAASSGKTG